MGKAERDVEIPPSPQVLDRIVRKCAGRLLAYVDGERLASDQVEQSLHVAEVAIDRGRLHPGGGAHRSRGDRVASAGRQQVGGRAHYAGSSVRSRVPRRHQRQQYHVIAIDNHWCRSYGSADIVSVLPEAVAEDNARAVALMADG